MKRFIQLIKKNQRCGQALIEYIIISTFIGICCLMAMKELGGVIRTSIEHIKKEIAQKVNTI